MPATGAPITTSNILGVNGRLWLNVMLPASGNPPGKITLALDANSGLYTPETVANPNAVNLGATRQGLKLNTSFEIAQEEIDEMTTPYRTHIVKENASIEGEMMELMDFAKLAKIVANGKLHTSAGHTQISGGGLLTLAPMTVLALANNPNVAGEVLYFMLYSGYNGQGVSFSLTRRADTGIPFRFEGLGVAGRIPGDQLFQIYEGAALP